jgi:hypothetical protein
VVFFYYIPTLVSINNCFFNRILHTESRNPPPIYLKVWCHEIELRPLVYNINNAPCISFTVIKSRVKNMRRFKQLVSRCKMAGAVFQSIAKLRAQIFTPGLAHRGVYSADCHNENAHTADCQSQESEFESGLP